MKEAHAQTGLGAVDFNTAFQMTIEPQPEDFDVMGHVNNIVYVRWIQDIATAHWRHIAPQSLQERNLFVVLRHEIDYRNQILPGERVIVRTWLGRAKGSRFERFVDIRKPDAARFSASARTDWCMISADTRKPARIGSDILGAFAVPG